MNKNELKKISIQFRMLASQMLKIDNDSELGYINTFVDFIDSTPIITKYISNCHSHDYDIAADMQAKQNWQPVSLPIKQNELIDYVYQIIKSISENNNLLRAWSFYYSSSNKFADKYQAFLRKTIEPFIHAIRSYLELQLIDSNDSKSEETKVKVFLSYCHLDDCIANMVDDAISERISSFGIISRDVRDVKYKESFRKFMESIGQYDYVVMIVSDNYLRSHNCLYEVLEVMRDRNYGEKLLFLVLSDEDVVHYNSQSTSQIGAHIYSSEGQVSYISYWKQQANELKRQIEIVNDPTLSIEQAKELRIITKIQLDLPEFMTYLREHNGIAFSKLIESNFDEIVDAIQQ